MWTDKEEAAAEKLALCDFGIDQWECKLRNSRRQIPPRHPPTNTKRSLNSPLLLLGQPTVLGRSSFARI